MSSPLNATAAYFEMSSSSELLESMVRMSGMVRAFMERFARCHRFAWGTAGEEVDDGGDTTPPSEWTHLAIAVYIFHIFSRCIHTNA